MHWAKQLRNTRCGRANSQLNNMTVCFSLSLSFAFNVGFILHQTVSIVQFQHYTDDKVFDLTEKASIVL